MNLAILCPVVLWAVAAATAADAVPRLPETVPLPETAWISTRFVHKQFRVSPATRTDMQGEPAHGIPAWQVAMYDGTGHWDTGGRTPLPKFASDIPASVRDKIALFLILGNWVAVPRGWHVLSAVAGATPTWGATFVAPDGARKGWLSLGGAGPGTTEVFSAAEGYFPGAYQLENEVMPGSLTRDPKLSPEPDSLAHPDPCTAVVSYESDGLAVRGVKLFQPFTHNVDLSPYVRSLFVALPESDSVLQNYLVEVFKQMHPTVDCQKKTW